MVIYKGRREKSELNGREGENRLMGRVGASFDLLKRRMK
jgi:hypothetical protein